ncbi:MAG: hypothetical protein HY427_03705 [Candidatus Levybacteria bacterium]|nr:hypothetical protein [Candidatus Levybacteria bacterium]
MADTIGQADIRGLDVKKLLKGYGELEYIFMSDLAQETVTGDSFRWYQETNGDTDVTSPTRTANVSFQSEFTNTEQSWTRNTSYVRKYAAEGFVPLMDIRTADIDVVKRTLRKLTRLIAKGVDTRIWDVLSQDRNLATIGTAGTGINIVTSSGAWGDGASSPVNDFLQAKRFIWVSGGYNAEGASIYMSPNAYRLFYNWVFAKGSQVPEFISAKLENGTITKFAGLNIKVSPNVTADYGLVVVPKTCATWYSETDLTTAPIENAGIGTTWRVWQVGEAVLTDPKSVCLISNIE